MDVPPRVGVIEKSTHDKMSATQYTHFYIPYHTYICETCTSFLHETAAIPSKKLGGHEKLANSLIEKPEEEYFEVAKFDELKISDGPYRLKLIEINPGLKHKVQKKDPMAELRKKIEKVRG
jgi:hypothetical protein